jgi:CheY-like chemotaxis protein
MMHGRIGVDSEQGKGTTFWFELDVDRASQQEKQTSTTVFADLSVEIVSPSPLYQSYYESLFEAWGIRYGLVAELSTAVERFEQTSAVYQVLLIDAELFNGKHKKSLAEWQRWRQKTDNVTVIVTCQQSMLAMVPQAINDVADLIVSKPVAQSELFESLLAIVKDDLASREAVTTSVMNFEHFDAHVLVVEDNPTNVIIVTGLLSKFGVEVSLAENGIKALTMLEHNDYDLVLMDCQMPELDGYETTRRVRQNDTITPIIALTAQAMREDEQKCLDAGMNAYLTKPIDPYQLNKLLAEWLPQNCLKKVAT